VQHNLTQVIQSGYYRTNLDQYCSHAAVKEVKFEKNITDMQIFDYLRITDETFYTSLKECLGINCTLICQKLVFEILKGNIEQILKLLLEDRQAYEKFIAYLCINFDGEFKDTYIEIVTKVVEYSVKNDELHFIVSDIFKHVVIKSGAENLKVASANKLSIYEKISGMVDYIDMPLVFQVYKIIEHHNCLNSIFTEKGVLRNFTGMLFSIPIVFKEIGAIKVQWLIHFLKLCLTMLSNPENFDDVVIEEMLGLDNLNSIMQKFQFVINNMKQIDTEHKIFYDIVLTLKALSNKVDWVSCSYNWPEKVYELSKASRVMLDFEKSDFVAYLMYYNTYIKEEDLDKLALTRKVNRNLPVGRYVSKITLKGAEKLSLRFTKESAIEIYETVGITSDREGDKLVSLIHQKDIEEQKETVLKDSTFYVHYPYTKRNLLVFGNDTQGSLGVGDSDVNISLQIHPYIGSDIKSIKSIFYYT
jgi:hypothetical protein